MKGSRKIGEVNKREGRALSDRTGKGALAFILALSIIGVAGLMSSTACCFEPAKREAYIASLPKGEAFSNDGSEYVWMPTLRAEASDEGNTNQGKAAGSKQVLNEGQMVERKGRYAIYAALDRGSARQAGEDSSRPVALNLRTNALAVVTGNLWLKLGNMQDAQAIAGEYGLAYTFSNAAMQTAFYRAPAGADMDALRRRLQADSRVLRVTLDMVDRIRHPR